MVFLLSERKCKYEKEIIEILQQYGADYISDKQISVTKSKFTVTSIYKKNEIKAEKGIAIFTTKNQRFKSQIFPIGILGICEENNIAAFESMKKNNIAVISCGINNKNTTTLSSIDNNCLLITLQRSIIDVNGNIISPCELKIKLSKNYSAFAVMACAMVLLLNGIIPQDF